MGTKKNKFGKSEFPFYLRILAKVGRPQVV